jgi:hypothetical protein
VEIVTDFPELAGPSGSSDQMTEARDRRPEIMSKDAGCAERFSWPLFATVIKPISHPRLLVSGLCFLLFAFSVPAAAQQAGKVYRIGLCRWARPKFTGVE